MKICFLVLKECLLSGALLLFFLSCAGMGTVPIVRENSSDGFSVRSRLDSGSDTSTVIEKDYGILNKEPLRITLAEAILLAVEKNPSLAVERMTPSIQQTFEEQERAKFDAVLSAAVTVERNDEKRPAQTGTKTEDLESTVYEGSILLNQFFPTGTDVTLGVEHRTTDSSAYEELFSSTRLGLSMTQALLRGYGTDANLARLRQSQLQTDISHYELRGFAELLVAQVENAYWDYALSLRQIEIFEESLKVAERQLEETQEMIQIGTMAEAELAAGQAEVAIQKQGLINAKSNLESTRLHLLQLLNPSGKGFDDRPVVLVHPPALPEIKLDDIVSHVSVAIKMRPEINQAKLRLQQEDLELVRTRNGLLPKMDLFISLGKTGYADSFSGSISEMGGDTYEAFFGARIASPFFNRAAKAEHRRSFLRQEQTEKALENLKRVVELDVRNALIEISRTKEQIAASTATRIFQEEKLRIEIEKFRVGRSTNLFVAQVQRDLLSSRINEIQALVNYLKALTRFYRLEGTLLERRGIQAPGSPRQMQDRKA